MRISIEGSISAGKTSIIRELGNSFVVYEENIPGWLPWIRKYSINPHRWGFDLQMKILLDMSAIPDNVIVERSPFTARHVFTRMFHAKGHISNDENRLYHEYYDKLGWKPDQVIFIDTDPEIAYKRKKTRARPGEEGISLEDLRQLQRYHEEVFLHIGVPVFRVDGNQPLEVVTAQVRKILHSIAYPILQPPMH